MFISPRLFVRTSFGLSSVQCSVPQDAAQIIDAGGIAVVPDLETALSVLSLLGASEDRIRYVATYRD